MCALYPYEYIRKSKPLDFKIDKTTLGISLSMDVSSATKKKISLLYSKIINTEKYEKTP